MVTMFFNRSKKTITHHLCHTNPSIVDKILPMSKLKAYSDELYVPQNIKFIFQRVENIVGKGENAGNTAFSPFLKMF